MASFPSAFYPLRHFHPLFFSVFFSLDFLLTWVHSVDDQGGTRDNECTVLIIAIMLSEDIVTIIRMTECQ